MLLRRRFSSGADIGCLSRVSERSGTNLMHAQNLGMVFGRKCLFPHLHGLALMRFLTWQQLSCVHATRTQSSATWRVKPLQSNGSFDMHPASSNTLPHDCQYYPHPYAPSSTPSCMINTAFIVSISISTPTLDYHYHYCGISTFPMFRIYFSTLGQVLSRLISFTSFIVPSYLPIFLSISWPSHVYFRLLFVRTYIHFRVH